MQKYIILIQMNLFLFSILTFILVQTQTIFRLNTKQTTRLQTDQSLTSTLGLFKATLRKNCSLEIFNFNQTKYISKGFYSSPTVYKNCTYLEIKQGKLMTSQNDQFISVTSTSFNESTLFTIDDLGVMRLIATYIKFNRVEQESFQSNISLFYTKHKYIYVGSQINVRFTSNFGTLQNERGWIYRAQNGQLDIFFKEDETMMKSYTYAGFKFNNSQILDFNSDTFPAAIFTDIIYQPRCYEPRIYLNFKPPFIIMADPYWPKVTVLEQGGYKIFEQRYSRRSLYYNQQQQSDIHFIKYYSECPDETFQHKGQCLTKCPQPYYHEMRGKTGFCRLVCEQFTPVDEINKICTCMSSYEATKYNSEQIISCPSSSSKYPYGCYCTQLNKYFDKKLTFSCVQKCPLGTVAYKGLCVQCSANCNNCSIDGFRRRLLQCRVCEPGYELDDGHCFKKCNTNFGNSMINGSCKQCADKNCVDCSDDVAICKKCSMLYTLANGKCSNACTSTDQLVPAQNFSSVCITKIDSQCVAYMSSHYTKQNYLLCDECPQPKIPHLNRCVTSCPQNYTRYEYNGWSYCSCKSGLAINNKCYNLSGCPIKMGFDLYTHSCLSCPFGCLTCMRSTCTSCIPGYFMYVSPQAIICRRQSPLFSCTDQYSLWNGICLVKQFQNLSMTRCRQNIRNCRVCLYNQLNTCVACQLGFYIFNNTCVKECPSKHMVYKNLACILLQIQNCSIPHLQSYTQFQVINITLVEKNQPYKYYILNGIEPANDPVGFIPYFQKITSSRRITDGTLRENSFFEPFWTCLKCIQGYGLSDDFKSCLPCSPPCQLCYMAKSNSCLQKQNTCQGYIDYSSKACIKSCNSTDSYPQLQNNILYCKSGITASVNQVNKIDSAIYVQENGTKLAYFVFENQITEKTNITIKIKKAVAKVSASGPPVVGAEVVQKVVLLNDKNYFEVLSAVDEDVFIADFTSSIYKLKSTQGTYPPNLVYGSATLNTHPQFMKTWLSIIGEIMAIVIIVMHCIYVGNELLYKMDNLIILVQTIYYFSFVKMLIGRLLAQFYYGWIFSHVGFFPNFFTTPNQYRENAAPISYKLATTDANFIRNAGYSLSCLIVFLAGLFIVSLFVYLIYKVFNKKQIWYPRIFKGTLLGGIEFFSMNIMYWAIAHLMYRGDCQNCDEGFHTANFIVSIVFIALLGLYTILRFFFNSVGGLYMTKRILIAVILPGAFNNNIFIVPLVFLEVFFMIGRFIIEKPQFKKQKLLILTEFAGSITVYLLMFLCQNAGVNTIIISIIIFIFIVALMSDFMQLYLQSVNEWQLQADNRINQVNSNMERAHTANNLMKKQR